MEEEYRIKCTIPTFILGIILILFVSTIIGFGIGAILSRQGLYIQHYHDESGYLPGDLTNPKSIPGALPIPKRK